MVFYFGIVCASLLSLSNARTTAVTSTAYPEFDNCGFNLNATCDDKMKLFADGYLLAESDDWKKTSMVYIPPNTKEIEIRCIDGWILGGILASSDNGLITNNAWNCSSDNGTTWKHAHELGANGVTAEDISAHAKWIWTDRPTWTHTAHKRHTTAICTIKLPTNSVCGTTPPPCTDCVPCLFNGTTPTPTPPEPTQVSGFNFNATCNNKMELFVDGNLLATSDNWRYTSQVHIPANTQNIEIHCTDSCWLIEGILASSDNGLLTDDSWNCSSDNGITWSSAHEIVLNGLSVPDISPNAKWISTGRNTWKDGGKVICKAMLAIQSVSPISTTAIPTGPKLEFQLKGLTGQEKVTISVNGNEEELILTKEWQTFSYPPPSKGFFSVEFHNDNGPRDVNIQGHESQVADLLPEFINAEGYDHTKVWGCGTVSENERCTWLRNGKLRWDGKYTYTLKGCPYNDKYVECPEFKDECETGNFANCMNRDCAKTCKCHWSAWGSWSECSATCGITVKSRKRKCLQLPCPPGRTEEVASCHLPSCGPYIQQKCFLEDSNITFLDLGRNHMHQDHPPVWKIGDNGRRLTETLNTRPSIGLSNLGDITEPVSFSGRVFSASGDDDVIGMVFGFWNEANFFVIASARQRPGPTNWYVARLHATCTPGLSCATTTTISDAIWDPKSHPEDITVLATGNTHWKHGNEYNFTVCFNPSKLLLSVSVTNKNEVGPILETGIMSAKTNHSGVDEVSRKGGFVGVYVDSQAQTTWDYLVCQDCQIINPPPSKDSIYFIAGGSTAVSDIELYHPTTTNLSCSITPPPLDNNWGYHTTFYYNNTIYLYGGWNTASTCISYNPGAKEWKTHTLTTSRYGHTTTILNKRIYIIGGSFSSNNYVAAESTPLPLTDQPVLTPVLNLDYKGSGPCTIKVDEDTLVIAGGYYKGYLSSVKEYNDKTRTTTSLPSLKQPREIHGCAVVEMDNNRWIIVAGGWRGALLKTTEMLQIGESSWTSLGDLDKARFGHSLAVTQRGVMAIGGYGGSGFLSSVELLDWSAKSWRIVEPSLSKSRSRFGGAVEIPASMFDCRDPFLIHTDSNYKYYKVPVPDSSKMTAATVLSTCTAHGMQSQCFNGKEGYTYNDNNCIRVEDCKNYIHNQCPNALSNTLCSKNDPKSCTTTLNTFWYMNNWFSGSACGVTTGSYCASGNGYTSTSNKQYFAACIKKIQGTSTTTTTKTTNTMTTTTTTTTTTSTITTTTKPELIDGTCYEDDVHRLLDDFRNSATNTPDECIATCASLGYSYAGVQNTRECFCGNDEPPASRIRDSSQCDMKCSGDASLTCGGSWRMNIYSTVKKGSVFFIGGGYYNYYDIELYHPNIENLNCSMTLSPLNAKWAYHTSFSHNKTIHLCGGDYTQSTCISYSRGMDDWKTHTFSKSFMHRHSTVILRNTMYVISGQDAVSTPLPLSDTPVLTSVPNLPYKGIEQCSVKMDADNLVITGGKSGSSYLSDVIQYNTKTNTATTLPSLLKERSRHGCLVIERENKHWMLVTGGWTGRGYYFNTTEMIEVGESASTSLGNLNIGRVGHSMVETEKRVMVIAGWNRNSLSSVEVLDWSTKQWTVMQSTIKTARQFFGTALEIPAAMFNCVVGQTDKEENKKKTSLLRRGQIASNIPILPEHTDLKLQFQLKGKTGTEKVKISVDDHEEEFGLNKEWKDFSYPLPSIGSFSVEFLNDIGYTDVFIRGHESQVTDLLPNFPASQFLGCGTTKEDDKCGSLRKGTLMWNGKYTYTLKGQGS